MSGKFFDDTTKMGTVVLIVGALEILAALIALYFGLKNADHRAVILSTMLASFVIGAIFIVFGNSIRTGKISRKIDILANFVILIGLSFIITGVIVGAGTMMESTGGGIAFIIVGVIIGAIITWIGKKINDGKVTMGDRLIYFLLIIFTLLGALGSGIVIASSLSVSGIPNIIGGICNIALACFIFEYLFDPEVKKEMGMA